MKFAFSAALLAVATTAAEVEAESIGYGASYGGYSNYGYGAARVVRSAVISTPSYATYSYNTHYNGCGHHTDSYTDSCSDSYSSHDFSSSDYGYGYKTYHGRSRYYRYRPRYSAGRYYYGSRYASSRGSYYSGYRSYPVKSYRSTRAYW